MKRSRFNQEQIIAILKEQGFGLGTADLYRTHGISGAALYKWQAKNGGLDVSDARRLKALEDENTRLKKLLAESMLSNAILKSVAKRTVTPRRSEMRWPMHAWCMACQRRACEDLEVDRSSVRYRSLRPDDRELREGVKTVASQRRRLGYRRIHLMLQRQGIEMKIKKLGRLYGEEKLQVCKRGGR